jgi:lysophospholipase L1-like esterase
MPEFLSDREAGEKITITMYNVTMQTTYFIFLAAIVLTIIVLYYIAHHEVDTLTRHHYQQRVSFFNLHPIKHGDIVFLGDSLTAGANWDEVFPEYPIKNRGINADTTSGLLARLDCVTVGKPLAIFILIGTNDLPWFEHRHDEMILGTYQEILEKIKKDTPSTKVFVESLLPRAQFQAQRIRKFNPKLKKLAETMGVEYIDLYPYFANPKGELRTRLNNDHLHLLAQGYNIWAEALRPYLKDLMK